MKKAVITKGKHKGTLVTVLHPSQMWPDFMQVELPNKKVINQHKAIIKYQ